MGSVISIQSYVSPVQVGSDATLVPLQTMGLEVFPLQADLLAADSRYLEGGQVERAATVTSLQALGVFDNCGAVISAGYTDREQYNAAVALIHQVKANNPQALFVCSPQAAVACSVGAGVDGIAAFLTDTLLQKADVIVLDQCVLGRFAGIEITDVSSAVVACQKAQQRGPEIVLLRYLPAVSQSKCTMMLAVKGRCYLVQRPRIEESDQLAGIDELVTAIFTGGLLKGLTPVSAFKHCNEALHGVATVTLAAGKRELQLLAARDEMVNPTKKFEVGQCVRDSSFTYYSI